MRSYRYKGELRAFARELRKNATPEENHLWYDFLATHPCQFKRQQIIDSFIADFYCSSAKLVIELDGIQHYTPEGKDYDRFRTEILEKHGLTVIRFSNKTIHDNFQGVCLQIEKELGLCLPPRGKVSPQGDG